MDADLIVRGDGTARAMPDRAILRVVIEGEGGSRDAAYLEAGHPARRVDEVVRSYGSFIVRQSTAALVVHPKTRYKKGETVLVGWRASRTSMIEVGDLERLGDLIADLTSAGASIAGPQWQLDRSNPAHGEARRLAAEDARRRAEDYAAALGIDGLRVAWIAEPGLRRGGDVRPLPHAAPAAARAAPAEESTIDVVADEIEVEATVDVGFSWSSPQAE